MKNINEWSNELKIKMNKFIVFWELKRDENSKNYPEYLETGDWDEQFNAFLEIMETMEKEDV